MTFGRVAFLVAAAACTLGAAAPPLRGTFALQQAAPKTNGDLRVTPIAGRPLAFDLDYWSTATGSEQPLTAYDIDMTKRLHMVIVRSDFRTFAHIHPTYANGHFHIVYRFPGPGVYHVYADTDPHGIGRQVFRFDVEAGGRTSGPPPSLGAPNDVALAAPYTVTLDRTTLSTSKETLLAVRVSEGGLPARDLHPYLGAPAHAVFLNASDLSYVHVHPMPPAGGGPAMPGMQGRPMNAPPLADDAAIAPTMFLHVALHEPGRYKLWLQFRGGGRLHVAQFVLEGK